MKKLSIILQGYLVRGPVAGMTWHHLNYFLGLQEMGHDVYFLEDSWDYEECCYNPETNEVSKDSTYGLAYADRVFSHVGIPGKWAYYNKHINAWQGPLAENIHAIIEKADMLINVSLVNPVRPWFEKVPVRIAIDTDPVFTQIKNINNTSFKELTNFHTHFFTFAENIYANDCTMPDDGVKWLPTRQPIYLPEWNNKNLKSDGKWTTIMLWESYTKQSFNNVTYGMKSISFNEYETLPKHTNEYLELALGNNGPVEEFQELGWHIINPLIPSIDPWTYRDYISNSKGEWSVAKHGYTVAKSGWFSERSACYLASGKPVVVQDTGFSRFLPSSEGILSFTNIDEAKEKLQIASGNYRHHCARAREIAEEYFDSSKVLNHLLERI